MSAHASSACRSGNLASRSDHLGAGHRDHGAPPPLSPLGRERGSVLVRGAGERVEECGAVFVGPDALHEVDARGNTVLIGFREAEGEMGAARCVSRLAGRVPERYLTAARPELGCLTALSARRSRPRVTSIAVFMVPTNGTAFSAVSAAPLSHPFCRMAAPSVASAIAVPKNGIQRPIRRDNRAPLQRATVRPMLMSVLRSKSCALANESPPFGLERPALSGKRYSVWKRFFLAIVGVPRGDKRVAGAQKGAVRLPTAKRARRPPGMSASSRLHSIEVRPRS
jgi:hypothetical protein